MVDEMIRDAIREEEQADLLEAAQTAIQERKKARQVSSRRAIANAIRSLSGFLIWQEDGWDLDSSLEHHMWSVAFQLMQDAGYDTSGNLREDDDE